MPNGRKGWENNVPFSIKPIIHISLHYEGHSQAFHDCSDRPVGRKWCIIFTPKPLGRTFSDSIRCDRRSQADYQVSFSAVRVEAFLHVARFVGGTSPKSAKERYLAAQQAQLSDLAAWQQSRMLPCGQRLNKYFIDNLYCIIIIF
jgi:hypothetical protein